MTTAAVIPICVACTRRRSFNADHPKAWCAAFPEGIPEAVFIHGFDHRKAFEGDHGIRFDLDPAKADRLKVYERQPV